MKIEKADFWGSKFVVFTLSLPTGREVYMRQSLTHNDCGFIVFVDSSRFESVWFKCGGGYSPHLHLARGSKQHRKDDIKFDEATNGFSLGKKNPVPLAFVGVGNYQIPNVCFTDGITRTIWLLVNDVPCFPVYVYNEANARYLHQSIGLLHSPVLSLQELDRRLTLDANWGISDFLRER